VDNELDQPLGERALSKLKWRCRRGLLENDLLIERFFDQHQAGLTVGQAEALHRLMDLPDNDLLDLLLRRTEPQGELDTAGVREIVGLLRPQST
jgi:antitoxin CptB